MKMRIGAIVSTLALGTLLFANYSRRNVVETCLQLAVDDPDTEGSDNAGQALEACREARELKPDDPEIVYRWGTALLMNDLNGEAIDAFLIAESLGHCRALYFLGEAAWYSGHDEEKAEDYYTRGAACGDNRAAREIFSSEVFAASAYPSYIAALARGEKGVEELNRLRFLSAPYVLGFYEGLGEQYLGGEFKPCWKENYFSGGQELFSLQEAEKGDGNLLSGWIYEKTLPYLVQVLFPALGSEALELMRSAAHEAGKGDLIRLVENSNCRALLPHKILKGVHAFAAAKRSLLDVAQEIAPQIHSLDDLRNLPWRGASTE